MHLHAHGVGSLGYWSMPAARRHGVASEAVLLAARYAVVDLGLDRVEIYHYLDNAGSCRVAAKAGFAAEGVLPGRLVHRGERRDAEVHALTAADLLDRLAADVPVLGSGAVRLRAWRGTDTPALVAACQDPEVVRWTSVPTPYTDDDAITFLLRSGRSRAHGQVWGYAAVGDAGQVLGSFHLRLVEPGRGEIGYWVAAAARRRGVGTAGLRLLVSHAVQELGIERIELRAIVGNEASQRLALAVGFRREGVQRAVPLARRGLRDLVLFALLTTDVPGVR